MLDQGCIEASQSLVVPLFREDIRLEPVECRGERDARVPPLARGQHAKRRILGQPFGVVGIFVAGQAAVDRLAEEVRQGELPIVSGTRIGEVPFDQSIKAETGGRLEESRGRNLASERRFFRRVLQPIDQSAGSRLSTAIHRTFVSSPLTRLCRLH